jgi:hypothetical protein
MREQLILHMFLCPNCNRHHCYVTIRGRFNYIYVCGIIREYTSNCFSLTSLMFLWKLVAELEEVWPGWKGSERSYYHSGNIVGVFQSGTAKLRLEAQELLFTCRKTMLQK